MSINKRVIFILIMIGPLFKVSSYSQRSTSFIIHFNTDCSNLSQEENSRLNFFIKNLDTVQVSNISILAYCDDRGNLEYNKHLSDKRAYKIKDLLSSAKIDKTLITKIEGKGELPLVKSKDKDVNSQRHNNRRSEILVYYSIKEKEVIHQSIPVAIPDTTKDILSDKNIGDKIQLDNLLFVSGRHILLPESFPGLDSLTNILKNKQQYKIRIIGYVCCVPIGEDGFDYDTGHKNLSHARAEVIYDYLINHGIPAKRLEHIGRGAVPTGNGDKYDRRVEFEIIGISNK